MSTYLIIRRQGDSRLPMSEVDIGPYRLIRVSATDPALSDACDPRWSYLDTFLLAPTKDAAPWEKRVAKELATELGEVREVALHGEPTVLPSKMNVPAAPTAEPRVPVGQAFLAGTRDVELDEVDPGDAGELSFAVNEKLGFELPDSYFQMLLETGLPSRARDAGRFLHWQEMMAAIGADFVPFYTTEDSLLAFDRDGMIVEVRDGAIMTRSAMTFACWIMNWRRGRSSLSEEAATPLGGRMILKRWRSIAKWVEPMYRGEAYW